MPGKFYCIATSKLLRKALKGCEAGRRCSVAVMDKDDLHDSVRFYNATQWCATLCESFLEIYI